MYITLKSDFIKHDNLYYNEKQKKIIGANIAIIPHASLLYCSEYIGDILSNIDWTLYDKIILLSTNHYTNTNHKLNHTFNYNKNNIYFRSGGTDINEFNKEHSWMPLIPYLDLIGINKIIPYILGEYDKKLVEKIINLLDDRTFIICNTDLIHCNNNSGCEINYFNSKNKNSIELIKENNKDKINNIDACGITVLKYLFDIVEHTKSKIIYEKIKIIKESSEKTFDVGYYGAIYIQETLNFLHIPRIISNYYLIKEKKKEIPNIFYTDYDTILDKNKISDTFVTVYDKGQVRGCIGQFRDKRKLYENICENMIHALIYDNKRFNFEPVKRKDYNNLSYSINFIGNYKKYKIHNNFVLFFFKLLLTNQFILGKHGLTLYFENNRNATYLAKVITDNYIEKQNITEIFNSKNMTETDKITKTDKITEINKIGEIKKQIINLKNSLKTKAQGIGKVIFIETYECHEMYTIVK